MGPPSQSPPPSLSLPPRPPLQPPPSSPPQSATALDDESEESNVNAVDGAADVSLVLIIAVSSGAAALLAIMLVLRRWQKLKSKRAILVSKAAMAVADAVLASPNKLETRNYGNQLCRI